MPAESQPIRILIADDQRMWLEALTALLSTIPGFEVAGTVTSGEKALAFCRHNPLPDLILLDLGMPEMDGFETMEKLLAFRPELKIIMLTVHEDFASIQESLQKGARGYVLKISSKEELEESIRQVYSGNRYFDARVRDIITEGMMSPVKKNGPSPLTPRETEVLGMLAEGRTSGELAKELFLSVNTIETHRKNILAKLGAKNIVEAIQLAKDKQIL
ncbi:MAG TPA: response regulator transcription factor [Flavilitoribacter sp.]|nr:response regulator transcription factor [Flavilitoribacter sp.]HMQ90954.1 response regulator transcription factor [Flavilitoribacter sp.]